MKVSSHSTVPVYTLSGVGASRELPEWLSNQRKRSLKKDPEFARRIELLQDFGFNEASSCVRASEDGQYLMSTGTYKPQIHVHYLPELSLSFARHTNNLNNTFLLISSDYSKSVHLQADRSIEFHTPLGMHHTVRIPRYGRDMIYARRDAEILVPATGVNDQGNGEVFRLNLELGRFMRSYEIDVGTDDTTSVGYGSLQGSLNVGSVNAAAIAEKSHGLLAFGTSIGTVEFWDPRCRAHVSALRPSFDDNSQSERAEVTAIEFHNDGLNFAVGSSSGVTHMYDLRSPIPLIKKDQGFGFPIKNIIFLTPDTEQAGQDANPKVLTSDKSAIKIWDQQTGKPWTSIQPTVDLNHVEWCPNSGMLLTANEGPQQHSFFIPKLGPAPKWCSFLDNIVEEMAEDANDPNAFAGQHQTGQVFDNFKFITLTQLKELHLDHLVGTTKLVRPYMHGYFISPKLYEEARMISDPTLVETERAKTVRERINKERESRIRGKKKLSVKVNRRLVERMLEREEKNEIRKARRVISRGGDDDYLDDQQSDEDMEDASQDEAAEGEDGANGEPTEAGKSGQPVGRKLLSDPRFASLFKERDFEVDEDSKEYQFFNAGVPTTVNAPSADKIASLPKGMTAVDSEHAELDDLDHRKASHGGAFVSSDEDSDDDDDSDDDSRSKKKKKHQKKRKDKKDDDGSGVKMRSSSSATSGFATSGGSKSRTDDPSGSGNGSSSTAHLSFETRIARMKASEQAERSEYAGRSSGSGMRRGTSGALSGERELVFVPSGGDRRGGGFSRGGGDRGGRGGRGGSRGGRGGDRGSSRGRGGGRGDRGGGRGGFRGGRGGDRGGGGGRGRGGDRRSASGNVMRHLGE